MDPELVRLKEPTTPKLNPVLANGLAGVQMKYVERYIDDIIRAAARDGQTSQVSYVNCVRCTPQEEWLELIRRRSTVRHMRKGTRNVYEVARTDAAMMKLFFRFNGPNGPVDLPPRFVYLPFVGPAGRYTANGVDFNIVPVLADRVISIGTKSIFVRFFCDRVTFHRTPYAYKADDVFENVKMVHSLIYHKRAGVAGEAATVTAVTSMAHYLFCKFGFTDTFVRFANCKPEVFTEYDHEKYPPEHWIICSSTGNPPQGYKATPKKFYVGPRVKVAVRREDYTPLVKALLTGFFYVADHFPHQVNPEYVDSQRQWMILMGHILFSGNTGAGRLYDSMKDHMDSLDEYVDVITSSNMKEIGVEVDNIYTFFATLIDQFSNWIHDGADKVNSMYDKELSVLYYVMFDLISSIFKFNFAVTSAAKKQLTQKDAEGLLDKYFNVRLIQRIRRNHGELTSNSYPGDNMAFGITVQLIPQANSTKSPNRRGGDRGAATDPSKRLHVSVAEIGSYTGMGKNDPSGRSRINHCAMTDDRFVIVRNPKFIELLNDVQSKLPSN